MEAGPCSAPPVALADSEPTGHHHSSFLDEALTFSNKKDQEIRGQSPAFATFFGKEQKIVSHPLRSRLRPFDKLPSRASGSATGLRRAREAAEKNEPQTHVDVQTDADKDARRKE